MFREVKLELTIIKQLRHPSIVTFMGAAVKFNDRGHKSDWYAVHTLASDFVDPVHFVTWLHFTNKLIHFAGVCATGRWG
jgi:hypothetical protein